MLNNIQRLLADYNLPANTPGQALDPKRQDLWLAQTLLFKQLHLSSMEHQQPQLIIDWLAENQQQLRTALAKLPISVQMPRYLSNTQGQYINADQWVACEFVTAAAASKSQLSFCIAAIQQFHHCLASFKKPEFIAVNQLAWAQADRACWGQNRHSCTHY